MKILVAAKMKFCQNVFLFFISSAYSRASKLNSRHIPVKQEPRLLEKRKKHVFFLICVMYGIEEFENNQYNFQIPLSEIIALSRLISAVLFQHSFSQIINHGGLRSIQNSTTF